MDYKSFSLDYIDTSLNVRPCDGDSPSPLKVWQPATLTCINMVIKMHGYFGVYTVLYSHADVDTRALFASCNWSPDSTR